MLELSNVTKAFANSYDYVLKDISLKLNEGDFCVVIGSNGSGKSTLLKTISGEYRYDSGYINIDGLNLANEDCSNYIASVVQDTNQGTIAELTLLENMALSFMRTQKASLKFYRHFRASVKHQIEELGLGLEQYLDKPIGQLSGGQRQMIATLMAINCQPKILLLDEHTSALDPKIQKLLMNYTVEAIIKNKITSMMITHKLDDAIAYGNRLIMLYNGRIIFDVSGQQKTSLTVSKLLQLFHKYEDQILTGEP